MVRSKTQTDVDEHVESLIRSLENDDWKVRRDAVRRLGGIDDERVVEPLTEARRDDNAGVRAEALDALRIIDDRRVVEPLIRALKNRSVRDYAIPLFKNIGGIRAIKSLIKSIDSEDEGVRWHTTPELVKIGKPVVASLIKALKHRSKNVRTDATMVICAMEDPETIDHLIGVLKYKNTRDTIISTLCKIGDERVVELLIGFFEKNEGEISGEWRKWYGYGGEMYGFYSAKEYPVPLALGRIGDPRAVEPLIKAFDECGYGSDVAGGSIAYALGEIGDPRAVEPLIETLKHPNAYTRRKAATALGMIGDPRAIEPLISALGDYRSRDVRHAAMDALVEIGESAGEALIKASEYPSDVLSERFEAFVWPIGKNKLDNRGWHMHELIKETLSRLLNGPEAVEPLVKAVDHRDFLIASAEIGEITVERLTEELGNDNWIVRWGAVIALGKIGDDRVVEPLVKTLDDNDLYVRRHVARVLGEIGDSRAVDPLTELLKDDYVRQNSVEDEMLEQYGWGREVIDDSVFVRSRAAEALGKVGDPRAVEPLIKSLEDRSKYVRMSAANALGEIGDPRAIEPLIEAMKKPFTSKSISYREVVDSLGKIGEPAIKPLIKVPGNLCDRMSVHLCKPTIEHLMNLLSWMGRYSWINMLPVKTTGSMRMAQIMHECHIQDVCERVKDALARIGEPAVEPLIDALEDDDAIVCAGAAYTLGNIGDFAVKPLIEELNNNDAITRVLVVYVLGEIADPRAIEPLRRLLDDSDESVRDIAACALEAME